MEFIRASVYGFAKWHDFQLEFHPSDLQVIYGENESGKSSLQQFILFMLFGLPPKRRDFFRSKTSGKMGGMLKVFEEEVGEYTIERVDEIRNGAARCLLPNGEEAGEEWLKTRLHGITRQTYQSIFSFDALDLSSLKTMKEEDLGEILFGIGLTGSTDIYVAEKRLDTKINELFKPFGKKPIINQQLDSLDQLYNKVQTFKSQEKTYSEKKNELNETNKNIEELQKNIKDQKENVSEIEKIRQALPNLSKLSKYKDKLQTYPELIAFPEDGLKRFESVKEKILPLESELAVLKNNVVTQNNKNRELKDVLMTAGTYEEVMNLLSLETPYNDLLKQKKDLQSSVREQEIALGNELQSIDSKLDLTELNDVSLAYQTENTWIQLQQESQKISLEQEKSTNEESFLQKQQEELEKDLEVLKDNCLSSKHVDELSNRIHDYNQSTQGNKNEQRKNFEGIKKQKQKNSMNVLLGSVLLGVICGLYGIVEGFSWSYAAAIGLIGIGVVYWIVGKSSLQTMEQLLGRASESTAVNVNLEEKEEAVELLAVQDETLQKVAAIENQIQSNKVEQIKWDERHLSLVQKFNRINDKVRQQREYYPILESIDVNNWPSFYHMYKVLLKTNLELNHQRELLHNVITEGSKLREDINRFFDEEKRESDFMTIDTYFNVLHKKVEDHNNKLQLIDQYESWTKVTEDQIDSLKQKLQVFKREKFNLLNAAEVETEEQFYQKNTSLKDKEVLEANIEEVMEQLRVLFSDEQIENLALENITNVTGKQKEYTIKLEDMEEQLEDVRKLRAELSTDLSSMESSDEHSEMMHRFYLENAELNRLAEKWAILKTAKEMLAETKNNYRDKYMSKIIDQTSDFFAILTNQAYINVFPPAKDQLFQVESVTHVRYTVTELSQGTKDQLYIALRLAISEVMSETHKMPFIIDDAFLHFDDIREHHMMHLIATIAKKRQVLLFTCKRQLANNGNVNKVTVLSESIRKM